jgi:hypothetical protein
LACCTHHRDKSLLWFCHSSSGVGLVGLVGWVGYSLLLLLLLLGLLLGLLLSLQASWPGYCSSWLHLLLLLLLWYRVHSWDLLLGLSRVRHSCHRLLLLRHSIHRCVLLPL